MNRQAPGIEYLTGGYTWNPYSGCNHDTMGICDIKDCWARRYVHRQRNNPKSPYSEFGFEPHFYPERLNEPIRRKKPALIGVSFMGDLFCDCVPREWIFAVLQACKLAPWHRFLLLTKNPKRFGTFRRIPENCWCGTSVTGGPQDLAAEIKRVQNFWSAAPPGRRFLSLEPFGVIHTKIAGALIQSWMASTDWAIVGGLSGTGARGCRQDDLDRIVKTCRRKRTPLFIKKNSKYPDYKKFQEFPEDLRL